ncbi:MAG: hypothetical protein U9O66_01730 [Patescibacteria group bacterium]|nr:hypothetical protein [Patescibacteria group bacterium]
MSIVVKIKDKYKKFVITIINDIFYISLISFIFFNLIELFRPRFVVSHLNLNGLLMLVVITGVITVVDCEKK